MKTLVNDSHSIRSHLHIKKIGKVPVHIPTFDVKESKYRCPICGNSLIRISNEYEIHFSKRYDNVIDRVDIKCCECGTCLYTDPAIFDPGDYHVADKVDRNKYILERQFYEPCELEHIPKRKSSMKFWYLSERFGLQYDSWGELEAPNKLYKLFAIIAIILAIFGSSIIAITCHVAIPAAIICIMPLGAFSIFMILCFLVFPVNYIYQHLKVSAMMHKITGDDDERCED